MDEKIEKIERLHFRVEHDLSWHTPASDEIGERIAEVRTSAKQFAHDAIQLVGVECRELSRALTMIEDASQQVIAGIVRHQNDS